MRVLDLAVTPDGKKLIAVTVIDRDWNSNGDLPASGQTQGFTSMSAMVSGEGTTRSRPSAAHAGSGFDETTSLMRRRVVIYDLGTKEELL